MKFVELPMPGVPDKDDPRVEVAMGVWDYWNADEQREFFRTTYRTVLAHERTGDTGHLLRYADSLTSTVGLESTTDLRDKIRASRTRVPTPADPADVAELLRRLES